jgi:hypothetical protein
VVLERLYRAEFRSEEEVEEVRNRLQTAVDQAAHSDMHAWRSPGVENGGRFR